VEWKEVYAGLRETQKGLHSLPWISIQRVLKIQVLGFFPVSARIAKTHAIPALYTGFGLTFRP
jgi:hypothetical protein